jgi:hypothetical protein
MAGLHYEQAAASPIGAATKHFVQDSGMRRRPREKRLAQVRAGDKNAV